MTTRTFRQLGIAYGPKSANITASVNNVVVYSGPVTTVNSLFPQLPNVELTVDNELFSWTEDLTYSGPTTLTITVDNNAQLLIADFGVNYTEVPEIQNGNVVIENGTPVTISSGPDWFVGLNTEQYGNTYVNNNLQVVEHGDLTGQWWWTVPAGGTFVENFTITPGVE